MLKKKINHKKALKGSVRKHLASLRGLYAVLFLMRDGNVILTTTAERLPLPVVVAKEQHALDSVHGFVVVMSDWTNLCFADG